MERIDQFEARVKVDAEQTKVELRLMHKARTVARTHIPYESMEPLIEAARKKAVQPAIGGANSESRIGESVAAIVRRASAE